jgi:hypothetical protein
VENLFYAMAAGDQTRLQKLLIVFRYIFKLITDSSSDMICNAIFELLQEKPNCFNLLVTILLTSLEQAVSGGFLTSAEMLLKLIDKLIQRYGDKTLNILTLFCAMHKVGWIFSCRTFFSNKVALLPNTLCLVRNNGFFCGDAVVCYRVDNNSSVVTLPIKPDAEGGIFTFTRNVNNGGVLITILGKEIGTQIANVADIVSQLLLIFLAYKLQFGCSAFDKVIDELTPQNVESLFELVHLHVQQFSGYQGKEGAWLTKELRGRVLTAIFKEKIAGKVDVDIRFYVINKVAGAFCDGDKNKISSFSDTMNYLFCGEFTRQIVLSEAVGKLIAEDSHCLEKIFLLLARSYIAAMDLARGVTETITAAMDVCVKVSNNTSIKVSTDNIKVLCVLALEQLNEQVSKSAKAKENRKYIFNLLHKIEALLLDGSIEEIYAVIDNTAKTYLKLITSGHKVSAENIINFMVKISEKLNGGVQSIYEGILKGVVNQILDAKLATDNDLSNALCPSLEHFMQSLSEQDIRDKFLKDLGEEGVVIIAKIAKNVKDNAIALTNRCARNRF